MLDVLIRNVDFLPIIIGILILFLIFLIFRAVALWYWRVNEIVDLLEEIRDNTAPNDDEEEKKKS